MKRKPSTPTPTIKYDPRPIDLTMQGLFYSALEQTAPIPEADRWGYVMELLPETFYYYVLISSQQPETTMMNRLGPLAIMLAESFFEEEKDTQILMFALYGILIVSVAELERKNLHFCTSVDAVTDPFLINLVELSPLHPKDPENFELKEVIEYYVAQYHGSDL